MKQYKGLRIASGIFLAGLAFSSWGAGDGGVVHFTGDIINATCDVVAGAGGGQDEQTVKLGGDKKISINEFSGIGNISVASKTAFQISLENCGSTTPVSVGINFTGAGATVATDSTALSVNPGGATGVGIRIFRGTDTTSPINFTDDESASKTSAVPVADVVSKEGGKHTFEFTAAYVQTESSVGEGAANADANYIIAYY